MMTAARVLSGRFIAGSGPIPAFSAALLGKSSSRAVAPSIRFLAVTSSIRAMSSAAEAFKKHGVVPDVVAKAPEKTLQASYNSGVEAKLGNTLTPTQVKDMPKVNWDADGANSLYTLILTDPDAPSRKDPKFREWHHWLVVNIPGTDVSKGETLAEYVGSGPPKDTGLHRYVFLVYKQSGKIDVSHLQKLTNRSGDGRGKFKAADFASKHHLGDPIAGNLYQAEWDDYVPILYKQLGG